MLLHLSQWLQSLLPDWGFLRVFQYLTLRAVLATLTGLALGLVHIPRLMRYLTRQRLGQPIRQYGMQSHLGKSGTPTMGGVSILLAMAVTALLWCDLRSPFVWIVLLVMLGFGAIGLVDDWKKVMRQDAEGMRARDKYAWQSGIGLTAALLLLLALPDAGTLLLPFFRHIHYPLGALGFVVFSYLVIVGASNAVNLTDGLDGLAILTVIVVGASLGVFAYVSGNFRHASYLLLPYIAGSGELLIVCAAMTGAGLAFLCFNAHPAQIFMGDVGALALGAALGTIAVVLRQELVLAIMGGIFVAEAVSVMTQTLWFKYTRWRTGTGRRIFRMSPLHHHFEKQGWQENHVVMRFFIITVVLCLIGLSTIKLR